ncbi:hypothetical protein [Caldisericum exile]|uniref:Uncharacterized protein n=1 Tax=Caldisericum exile (strain DSM 21853 / NBRC 104410 / AZM16c01) TaxID=511051 RepID=A0A7U6GE53_CALEA|nr:hypothetical protein [Caldisericum exile]BAL80710.1 hypothetical protein CSE_05840 [Caldisericum exile AZM16c01]
MKNILEALKKFFMSFDKSMREAAISLIEHELVEEENVFALVTMSMFSGLPSPPTGVILRILPYMEREIQIMTRRSAELDDIFAQTLSHFDID